MILRTPPQQRKRKVEESPAAAAAAAVEMEMETPNSDQPLVIYEDPHLLESSPHPTSSEQFICTYQCKQMVKAEFLDALTSAEKQASQSTSKLEILNRDFAKSEEERQRFRDKFLYAEQELAAAKRREQVLQDQLLKEVDSSHERLRKQIQLCNEIEEKYQKEMSLRKKAESTAATAEERSHLLEAKLSSLSDSIEREKTRLQSDLGHLKSESKFSVSKISKDLERMELRANNAEKESLRLTEQLEDMRKKLYECMEQKSEAEKKISSMMYHVTSSTDSDILVKNLREELRSYESEVHEARKLKSSHENIEVLKEKLGEEKGRRERAELEVLKSSEFQLKVTQLEDELSAWNSMIRDIPGLSCANEIPLKFAALQKEVVDSMMKVGDAQSRLKQMEVDLDAAKLDQQKAETEATMAKEQVQLSTSDVKRMELMISSVSEERDGLKKIIDELRRQRNDEVGAESSGTAIQELEAAIATKENCIKELKGNICELKEVNARQHNEIKLLNERHSDNARSIKLLERESDRLRSEVALLESKLGHGDFSSTSTKVLRMVNTLTVDNEAKQTIEALKNELQKTKEKLQAVEELKKQSGSGAVTLDDSYVSGKIIQLKEQVATLEKREERYKTVFADRISVFRRACCELFGYKIVMDDHQRSDGIPVTRFTLQSIYAQRDDEKLEFEYESGNTSILGNDYTSQSEISRQVDIFIRKLNSIPAFTANLTVESFNKRTLC